MKSELTFNIPTPTGEMRDLKIEGYEKNGMKIISFSKLRAFYQRNKELYGLKISIEFCDSKISSAGEVIHAFAKVTIKDKKGYSADYVGEIVKDDMNDNCKHYPLAMAINRAYSAALLNYFMFPEDTFTTVQIVHYGDEETASGVSTSKECIPLNENKKSEEKETSPELENAPQNENEHTEVNNIINNTPEIDEESSIPYNDNPSTEVQFPGAISDDKKEQLFPEANTSKELASDKSEQQKENDVKTSTEANTSEAVSTPASDKAEEVEEEIITEDSKVGFGKYPNITIKELIDKRAAGDDFAKRFITMMKSGSLVAANKHCESVIKYISKNY